MTTSSAAFAPAAPSHARGSVAVLATLPPLSLYVHLPWCIRKCPYCDFNSYEAGHAGFDEDDYVSALLRDLDAELPLAQGRAISSVFIGGGTPSLFSGAATARLLSSVRERLPLAEAVEVTLEANPGAAEAGRFAEYRDAGVNRLSIGVQSLRSKQLARLGRVHGPEEAERAIELARGAGFTSFNLDLMYALPDDDAGGALADLAAAVALDPPHLSWYQLTLEPNTAFHRKPPPLPAEDVVLETERRGRELLGAHGYARYEVSAYARAGQRCAHNLNYWRFGDYLGIGAGAHGKVTLPGDGVVERRAKTRNPRTYSTAAGTPRAVAIERIADARQIAVEFLMNALRLPGGVPVALFEQRAGQELAAIEEPLRDARARGWLAEEPGMLRPTAAGLEVLNRLLALFC
ncbi:MAG TPA: radical SAM family heme chaperone HemW [Gammaproteobacteria bacterium]|nr:radical SAM family heme chaperone HemW [Gammaproteobacteria bacterium]